MGDSENITTGMYIFLLLLLLLLFCSWWIHAILDSIYLHYDPLYPSLVFRGIDHGPTVRPARRFEPKGMFVYSFLLFFY
jgi:hypothetical protein